MRWFVAILGLPMVLGLTAVSVVMNFRFGLLLGRSHLDGLIYASASACADILKCLIPIVLGWSWANRRLFITLAAGLLFLIFTAYSVTSSLGYAAINRAERSGQRAAEISRHRDLRAELDHKLAQRTSLPAFRPAATLDAELLATRQHARWTATRGCAQATLVESRAFCDSYFRLKAERATAEAATRLDEEIAGLRRQVAGLSEAAQTGAADPQLELIAQILSLGQDTARLALTILLSALVECGSAFGFTIVLAMWNHPAARHQSTDNTGMAPVEAPPVATGLERQPVSLPPPPAARPMLEAQDTRSVTAWADARLMDCPRRKIFAATLYADYVKWSHDKAGANPVTWTAFALWMADAGHAENVSEAGRIFYLGIGLRERAVIVGD